MSVVRVHKKNNYTVISNEIFKNKKMSLKAKGLFCTMLSLPDSWNYSLSGLESICCEGIKAIRSTLKELEKFGYLYREKIHGKDGKIGYIYHIYEDPCDCDTVLPKPCDQNGHAVNGTLLNTNNKILNINTPLTPLERGEPNTGKVNEDFEIFWKLYPKKIAKQYALKSWKRLKPSKQLQEKMMQALRWQKESEQWKRDGGKYIPNPATWLNGGYWDNEPEQDNHPIRDPYADYL